jgi:hypothetical protein
MKALLLVFCSLEQLFFVSFTVSRAISPRFPTVLEDFFLFSTAPKAISLFTAVLDALPFSLQF